MSKNHTKISEEVLDALNNNKPVVALESTIISHGMPWPDNYNTALTLEKIVRENGCVPATIAIHRGSIQIGMSEKDIESFAQSSDIHKASKRDIPFFIATKQSAATTVAATMFCASLAKIKFFATGGIGGVHRNASNSFDVSGDLTEFVTSPVFVVSAGAKAILDIGKTLEYLETLNVPVLGYKTKVFPAFYYADSGYNLKQFVHSAKEAAESFKVMLELGLKGGMLLANPVPENEALEKNEIEACIEKAVKKAKDSNITGAQLTPFLLANLKTISVGKSLKTNIALVKNNALICSKIASLFNDLYYN